MNLRLRFKNILESPTIKFSMITYLAIGINGVSGVILARTIGPTQRGVLAYYANFLLLTSFMSAPNIVNATARTINKIEIKKRKVSKFPNAGIIWLGFSFAAIAAFTVSTFVVFESDLNKNYFIGLMLVNGLGAFTSLYEGYWRYSNSIKYLTYIRFIGLAAPSLLTLFLIAIGKADLKLLLLGQFLVTMINFQIIFNFNKKNPLIHFPDSIAIIKSALKGFPTYLVEYLVTWIVPFMILRLEGSKVLGWYVVALSYALLADVTYGAIEAKNYRKMLTAHISGTMPKFSTFIKISSPILGMNLAFMPLVILIPLIYGQDFKNSSLFAIAILVARIPLVISRSITSYLISLSRNLETFVIFLSFLVSFLTIMLLTNVTIFSFYWIPAYAISTSVMLYFSFLFLRRLNSSNSPNEIHKLIG